MYYGYFGERIMKIALSKKQWEVIGKNAGWFNKKLSQVENESKICPQCGDVVWDVATLDQRLNKCWECGLRFDNEENEHEPENDDDVERRRIVRVEFSDGDHLKTEINGTKQSILDYYLAPDRLPQDYDLAHPERTRMVTDV